MDDAQFRAISSDALDRLQRSLERAADRHEFDVDRNEGALTIEFEDPPGKFVVSPNSAVRQIWISATGSRPDDGRRGRPAGDAGR